jgi:hypothetical protein
MKIRKLLPGDLEALARLHRQFWDEASNLDQMKARYESGREPVHLSARQSMRWWSVR